MLLGLRSAWGENLKSTAAELVYGEPMRIPGESLSEVIQHREQTPTDLVHELKEHFAQLRSTTPLRNETTKTFIFKDLESAVQMFVRRDPFTGTLQSPYEGPFAVAKRGEKTFVIKIHGRNVTLSSIPPANRAAPVIFRIKRTGVETTALVIKLGKIPTHMSHRSEEIVWRRL